MCLLPVELPAGEVVMDEAVDFGETLGVRDKQADGRGDICQGSKRDRCELVAYIVKAEA
jgi:hypothetical protein